MAENLKNRSFEGAVVPPAGNGAGRLDLPYLKELGVLMVAWLVLFHFYGNSTLGYVETSSLFGWWQWTLANSPTESHAYFMPLLTGGLIYYRWARLNLVPKGLWWPGLAIVVVALIGHLMGYLIQQTRISVLAFVLGIYGATGLFWGWRWMRAVFLPFSLLAFSVPIGSVADQLTFPLRLMATTITSTICRGLLGIDVIQQGNLLSDAGGHYRYEVAAACSGLQSLTAIVIFSIVYAFIAFRSPWRIALILLSGLPMAVVANVVRLMMIVMAAEVFGQPAGDLVHRNGFFSMLPYIPALLGVFLIGRWVREKENAGQRPDGEGGSPGIGKAVQA